MEKAKIDAENQRKLQVENVIKELGLVYFGFDSSYLRKEYKELLDKLTGIMLANPTLTIKIGSYTDSRGTAAYNLGLSKRRVDHTLRKE